MTDQPVDPVAEIEAESELAPPARSQPPIKSQPPTKSHAFLRYTTARIALFVLAVFVVWLTRLASGVLLVIIALFISGLASFALL
ncbi:MAG TPA: hypothetical protein VK662_02500, partial [Acidothermaceae bacterium]|nr:hypothetical protein [Acidothermaceae bacterium]